MRRIRCSFTGAMMLLAILALMVGTALAAQTKKPAGCPAKVSQLTGCIQKVDAAKSVITLDCNGIKHQVVIAKDAKVTLGGKTVAMKNLKKGTKVTAYGACAPTGTQFKANQICECATPRPKAKTK